LLKKLDQQDNLSIENSKDNSKNVKQHVCKNIEAFDKMKNEMNKSQQVKYMFVKKSCFKENFSKNNLNTGKYRFKQKYEFENLNKSNNVDDTIFKEFNKLIS